MVWREGYCRTPHGVRGLKLRAKSVKFKPRQSHPARGAWIEISIHLSALHRTLVAPRTGCVD